MFQFVTKSVPSSAIVELNNEIVIGLAKDLRPLGTVEGAGFLRLAQALVKFGSIYGNQNVREIIHHRTNLKRTNLPGLTIAKRTEICELLAMAPSKPTFAFTTDMWTDKHSQRSFLSFTVHYVNNEWQRTTHMLAVDEFMEEKKTTANIRKECERILGIYFIQDEVATIVDNSFLITNGGSNMINVFPKRLSCQCHKLNLMVHWMLNDKQINENGQDIPTKKKFRLSEECPKIKGALAGVKKVVRYFKQSSLNSSLSTTLKQDVPTRWNSELIMLKSYLKVAPEVKKKLLDVNNLQMLSQVDDAIVEELILFLTLFADCTNVFSGDKFANFHLIAPWYHTLKSHIAVTPEDSSEFVSLKRQAEVCFAEYCKLDILHYVACMLHPR